MSVLIFGANGQDGRYLIQRCSHHKHHVIAVSHSNAPVIGDVAKPEVVNALVEQYKPAYIFHLAAKSTTRHEAAFENHAIIGTGTLNILEAVYRHHPAARVFLAGSGLQFANRGEPIAEDDPFDAASPYAATRIYAAYLCRYYRRLGLKAYFGFLFHHESPYRKPAHLSRIISDAARRAVRGERFSLEIGDLGVEKEWTFAGDMVEAMWTLVSQDEIFEANLGSGIGHSVAEWAEACFATVGLDWRDYVVAKKDGFQPEYRRLVCNPSRIHSLGWKPQVGLRQLAGLMVRF